MSSSRRWSVVIVVVALLAGGLFLLNAQLTATENGSSVSQPGAVHVRYTVVQTDGLHLIVTDNAKNTTYFYAIDEGEKPGADLKLRGSVDLTQIGQEVIKPNLVKRN
jgi:hypothetical protein